MLGSKEESVIALLGRALGTARTRYRSERALSFLTDSMRAEVGFLREEAVYAVFRKRNGSRFQQIEIEALLYAIGPSADWEVRAGGGASETTRSSRPRKTGGERAPNVMDFIYKERRSRTAPIQRVLFAQLHAGATQLAVFRADWLPDLEDLARNPLK